MKNMLAAFAVALAPVFAPALAADGNSDAGDEEKQPTMAELEAKIDTLTRTVVRLFSDQIGQPNSATDCSAASPCGLWGRLENLTTDVRNLANRGHQMAVVKTRPDSPVGVGASNHTASYYLTGNSTIPGFPAGAVAADGKFAEAHAQLPVGEYLFEMYQPASDNLLCHGRVFLGRSCPRFTIFVRDGTSPREHFTHTSAVFAVTSNLPSNPSNWWVRYRFPTGVPADLTKYEGRVKITKLK